MIIGTIIEQIKATLKVYIACWYKLYIRGKIKMQEKTERATLSSNVKKQKVELDIHAVRILNEVRDSIKSEGKSGITYSDAIRWLAVKAGIREGTM